MELNSQCPLAFEELQTRGDDAIEWLVKNYFPMLDPQILKNQALKVRLWAKERHDRFLDKDEADPSWSKARRDKHKPRPRLRIVGRSSIAEALFKGAVPDIEQFLHVFDDMIARSLTSCDVERAGSQVTLTKNKLRTLLDDDIFADLVFLAFNLPYLHEIDTNLLVRAWKAAGHRLPLNKNDADSIVLTRLLERTSPSRGFFLKKDSPYKPTDLSFLRELGD